MATSKWSSSLANIEARVRRTLGIAGPINLTLDEHPNLLPVMLVEDATRPGAASDYRGRRWACAITPGTIAGSGQGMVELMYSASGAPSLAPGPGLVVDTLEVSAQAATTTQIVTMAVYYNAPFEAPDTALLRSGAMVDPIGKTGFPGTYESPPIFVGSSAVLPVGTTGARIWTGFLPCTGLGIIIPLDLYMLEQAFLAVGNSVALVAGQPATFWFTFRGRVF
ncbi:MAG TPA: hypothetical protein VK573_11195 [Gemmatimonadales bacterium]|nr:hypothetical protein [Gemmatimonadales bacterium]